MTNEEIALILSLFLFLLILILVGIWLIDQKAQSTELVVNVYPTNSELEIIMSDITKAVNALTDGVKAHGEVIVSRMEDLKSDFAVIQAKLDAALGNDAEAAEAVARINEATAAIAASGATLSTLDLDPANPQVPSPASDEPTV